MVAASGCAPPIPPSPGGQDPSAGEIAAVVPAPDFDEGLVGALHDPLAADIDPGAGGHLAVHHEAEAIELVELFPSRPVRHEVRIGDQNARRIGMRAEDADRLAGLDEQRLVGLKLSERRDNAVEALPVARGAADAAVDDELARPLRHLRVEVIHEHSKRRLGQPGFRRDFRPARRADGTSVVDAVHAVSLAWQSFERVD